MRYLLKNTAIVNNNGMRDNVQVLVEGKKILKVSREILNIPAVEYDLSGYTLMAGFIELLLKAGLTMNQVIKAATLGGAEILGKEGCGKIEDNCAAYLIAVKGNPYELPYLLSSVNFIMKDGIVIKNT